MKKSTTHNLTVAAMLSAVAFILMFIEFPVPMLIPSFVKMDFSDLPALLGAFALGPMYGVVISFMKNLLHIVIKGTSTACVGELCNFMLGAVFSAVAGVIYKHHKSRKTAIIGAIAGAAAMAVFSVPSNYFITYPAYVQFYHMPLEAILGMYQAILPSADSLIKCLVIFNMPFTLVKGLLDAVLCMLMQAAVSHPARQKVTCSPFFLLLKSYNHSKTPRSGSAVRFPAGELLFRGKYIRQRSIRLMPLCPAICRVPAAQGTVHRAGSAQSSWPSIRPPAQNAEPAGKPA